MGPAIAGSCVVSAIDTSPAGFYPQIAKRSWKKGKLAAKCSQPQLAGPTPRPKGQLLLHITESRAEHGTPWSVIAGTFTLMPNTKLWHYPSCRGEGDNLHCCFTLASSLQLSIGLGKIRVWLASWALHSLSCKGPHPSHSCIKQRHNVLKDTENLKSRLCSSLLMWFVNLGELQSLSEKQEAFEWLLPATSISSQMKTCRWKHLNERGFVQLVVIWIILNTSSLFLPDFCCG